MVVPTYPIALLCARSLSRGTGDSTGLSERRRKKRREQRQQFTLPQHTHSTEAPEWAVENTNIDVVYVYGSIMFFLFFLSSDVRW